MEHIRPPVTSVLSSTLLDEEKSDVCMSIINYNLYLNYFCPTVDMI
jgi:hypothetical protein